MIANRGEIVVRVLKTLQEMGITGVAVYSEPDAKAPHVLAADEAYLLGPAEAAQSYLNQDKLIEVAKATGCDGIHPGYGFLSENATFARRVEAEGLTWIGPPPSAIDSMGGKVGAREIMIAAGVPVVPGTDGSESEVDALEAEASTMKYPVLIKASAGGGGKGMRVVHDPADFRNAAEAAKGEAKKAFGDDTVYVEKYIERPRHIEFQVFADGHGNFIHLFERECSIQRRHQKIVEETPSPAVTPEIRKAMGDAAIAAAKAVDYRGAGTIEFLLDDDGSFYFLEMNTRLQVEHPVTEEVTGLDLVRMQIEVASGLPIAPEALDAVQRGHSLECRVYAEDPAMNFLPMSGTVIKVVPPTGPGVRVDHALRDGLEVSVHYDPMLAKVITYGRDRNEAIERMRLALREFVVLGIRTNLGHLQAVLDSAPFVAGDMSTHFLDEHMPGWKPDELELTEEARAGLMLHDLVTVGAGDAGGPGGAPGLGSPWRTLSGWRHLSWRERV